MEQAINIPEILLLVFRHLEKDIFSLRATARVNRTWFHYAIAVLWASPTCYALAKIGEARRQIYAGQVRDLIFEGKDHRYNDQFRDLNFKRLRKVTVNTYRQSHEVCLGFVQYLQPSLEELALYGINLEPIIFTHLQTRCPRLRKISIAAPGIKITSHDFLTLLHCYPLLEHVGFTCQMDNLVSDEVLIHLASRDNMKSFESDPLMSRDSIRKLIDLVPIPFKALKDLSTRVSSPSIPDLVGLLLPTPLRTLTLEVEFVDRILRGSPHLTELSRLVYLENLELCTSGCLSAIKNEFTPLQQLKHLRSLRLRPDPNYPEIDEFTDADLDKLLTHLPLLENFRFSFIAEQLSLQALGIISERCPRLTQCEVGLIWTGELMQSKPLFPLLEELSFAAFRTDASEEEEEQDRQASLIARLINFHCPSLGGLDCLDFDDFSSLVIDKWYTVLA